MVIYPGSYNVGALVFKHPLSVTGNGNVIGQYPSIAHLCRFSLIVRGL